MLRSAVPASAFTYILTSLSARCNLIRVYVTSPQLVPHTSHAYTHAHTTSYSSPSMSLKLVNHHTLSSVIHYARRRRRHRRTTIRSFTDDTRGDEVNLRRRRRRRRRRISNFTETLECTRNVLIASGAPGGAAVGVYGNERVHRVTRKAFLGRAVVVLTNHSKVIYRKSNRIKSCDEQIYNKFVYKPSRGESLMKQIETIPTDKMCCFS